MLPHAPAIPSTLLACTLLLAAACERAAPPSPVELEDSAHPALVAHSAEFEKRVHLVTDGVHQAVGFGLANSILVEGEACAFVVDTLGSIEAAREVRAEFEKLTRKPIRALIYTHNHGDHVFGARAFASDGELDVYAQETTADYVYRIVSLIRPIITTRSARMFGTLLPARGPDRIVNAGIGPHLEIGHGGGTLGWIPPNRTFRDRLETTLCGVQVELVHAPGETPDQLFVWLPERGVLMPGDNVYKAFPNLYTIRGTLYRDVLAWAHSIDLMRARRPQHLAPSHTRPLSGEEPVMEVLTAYRDAIQFVHDQTLRGMNAGLTPDELVEAVRLPPHLRDHPWLQELYGTLEWSVRSVFTGYLGWFDGDATSLSPAPPEERARGYVALAGGPEALLQSAREALAERRFAWAAELAGHLVRAEPDRVEARRFLAAALRALGQRSANPNGRNYYLTQALELEGSVRPEERPLDDSVVRLVEAVPIAKFLAAMTVRLDAEKSADWDRVVGFRFPDVNEHYTLHVRRGVADLKPGFPEAPDLSFVVDASVWREIAVGRRGFPTALAAGDVRIEGSQVDAVRFLRLFRSGAR